MVEAHDGTIQTLYAIALKLEYCLEVIDQAPEQVKAALRDIVAEIDEYNDNLRSRIRELT
jgi:signal transduction histidine kinase